MKLRFSIGKITLDAELADTPTSKAIIAKVPFESTAQTWGDEVYFSTPVSAKREPGAQQVVEAGTVCFWCEGDSIALPFGRTPISTDHRPKLANPCNVLGTMKDFALLKNVRTGDKIRVEKA
ncbi:MAG TPA: cyclophilin-like fold protein [Burkholderiales bacterium]